MHYLIDGHNLLAKMATIEIGETNGEAELVLLLRRWTAGRRNRKVSIVFDGGLPGGAHRGLSTNPVKVIFAPKDRTADDLLIAQIRKMHNPSEFTIVTDDRAVIKEGQARKAVLLSSVTFARTLDDIDSKDDGRDSADDPPLNDADIDEWLKLFNQDQSG
jgi:predicted RNA-binding protein with PIN domain